MKPGQTIATAIGVALLGGGLWWTLARPATAPRATEPALSDEAACRQGDMPACDRLGLCRRSGSCRALPPRLRRRLGTRVLPPRPLLCGLSVLRRRRGRRQGRGALPAGLC